MEPPLCVVSSWIIRVYIILVWNTISGSSNLDTCFYHCLILTLIFHIKILINFFFFFFFIVIIVIIIIITTTTTTTTIIVIIVVVVLLLFIIYTINLLVVWPRSCRVIYYFDTPALGRRHQSFDRVSLTSIFLCFFFKKLFFKKFYYSILYYWAFSFMSFATFFL